MSENNLTTKQLFKILNEPGLTAKMRVIANNLLQTANELDEINKEIMQQMKRKHTQRNKNMNIN